MWLVKIFQNGATRELKLVANSQHEAHADAERMYPGWTVMSSQKIHN